MRISIAFSIGTASCSEINQRLYALALWKESAMRRFQPQPGYVLFFALGALACGAFCLLPLWIRRPMMHGDRQVILWMFGPFLLLLAPAALLLARMAWDALAGYQVDAEGVTRQVLFFQTRLLWRDLSDFKTGRSPFVGSAWTLIDTAGRKLRVLTGLSKRGYALDSYIDAFVAPLRAQQKSIQRSGVRTYRYNPAGALALIPVVLIFIGMIVASFVASRVQPGPGWPFIIAISCLLYGGLGMTTLVFGLRTATYSLRITPDSIIEKTIFHHKTIAFDQVVAFHSREIPLKDGKTQTVSEITDSNGQRITFSELLPDYALLVATLRDRVGAPALQQGQQEKKAAERRWSRQQAKTAMILGPLLCLLLLGMAGWGLRDGLDRLQFHERLDREGVSTVGTITDFWSQREGKSGTGYYLAYQFSLNGRVFQRSSPVTEQDFERAAVGNPAPLTYLPSDPSQSRLANSIGKRKAWSILGSTGLAIAGTLAMMILLFVSGYQTWKKNAGKESENGSSTRNG